MKTSCIGLTKICFLLSVSICVLFFLFIPWMRYGSLKPHPLLVCNITCSSRYPESQLELTRLSPSGHNQGGSLQGWKNYKVRGAGLKDTDHYKGPLQIEDVFIAVKTTQKYHRSRLDLLLETWISKAKEQTFIFTDWEDQELRQKAGNQMVNTNCSAVHTRQALCCKMAVEYDKFVSSSKKWFCHLDDDNYLNLRALLNLVSAFPHNADVYVGRPSLDHPVETLDRVKGDGSASLKFWFATGGAGFCISRGLALKMSPWASMGNFISTAEKVRLPDDCTIGYIIEGMLEVKMQHSNLFHSHLENLQRLPHSSLLQQLLAGIGRELVKALWASGAEVVALSRTSEDLESLVQECPGVQTVCVDLEDWPATEAALSSMGPVDLLVNNAGIAYSESFLEIKQESFDRCIAVNTRAVIPVSQIVIRQMMERGVPGSIVNVSSILSQSASKNVAIYCASKAALDMLTKAMALEFGPQKIRVNCVNPTTVLTRMTRDHWSDHKITARFLSRVPLGRIAEFDDVINSILFLLSDKSAMITGTCLNVEGGFLIS